MRDFQKISKPVIGSQLSAQLQTEEWTRSHDFQIIIDSDGLKWTLVFSSNELVKPTESGQPVWESSFHFKTEVDAETLLQTRVLGDAGDDERLLSFIAENKIPLILKPVLVQAPTLEDLRKKVPLELANLKKKLQAGNLKDIKRNLVARWVDRTRRFKEDELT
ncbi:MAG: hypothetical protein KA436_04985 [Oligoflexales bacterium]|nr:hypothetical protein [Oligoflexales bacterium]